MNTVTVWCEAGVSNSIQLCVIKWGVKQVLRCNTIGFDTVGHETGFPDAISEVIV